MLQLKSHTDPHTLRGRFQYTTIIIGQVIQSKTRQKNTGANRLYKPNGPNRYLQNILPKHKRIDLLLRRSSWNLHQSDHILNHKASLNRYREIEITPYILTDHYGLKPDFQQQQKSYKLRGLEQLNVKLVGEE